MTRGGVYYLGLSTRDTSDFAPGDPSPALPKSANRYLVTATLDNPAASTLPAHGYDVTTATRPTIPFAWLSGATRGPQYYGLDLIGGRTYRFDQYAVSAVGRGGTAMGLYDSSGNLIAADTRYVRVPVTGRYVLGMFPRDSTMYGPPPGRIDTLPGGPGGEGPAVGPPNVAPNGEYRGPTGLGSDYQVSVSQSPGAVSVNTNRDGRTALVLFRPRDNGHWFGSNWDGSQILDYHWGEDLYKDIPAPGDFFGFGLSSRAVYRPGDGTFLIEFVEGQRRTVAMGDPAAGDVPAVGDYDGDGVADPAVFRPSTATFFIHPSSGLGARVVPMGDPSQGDLPVPADYDGDSTTDFAVFRPATSTWIIRLSSGGTRVVVMGDPSRGDLPIPGDYDGDGKSDLAVFRPASATWIIRLSSGGVRVFQKGDPLHGDLPVNAPIGSLFRAGKWPGPSPVTLRSTSLAPSPVSPVPWESPSPPPHPSGPRPRHVSHATNRGPARRLLVSSGEARR